MDDSALVPPPVRIDLKKDEGLTIEWADGVTSFYPILHLRRMSPSAELVGNYALRIAFSDGHRTGIYSWRYLREIDPGAMGSRQ